MKRSVLVLTLLIIAVLIFGAYKSSADARKEVQAVKAIKGEIEALKTELEILKLEVAHLSADTTIETLAREKLGMRLPDPGKIIVMADPALDNTEDAYNPNEGP